MHNRVIDREEPDRKRLLGWSLYLEGYTDPIDVFPNVDSLNGAKIPVPEVYKTVCPLTYIDALLKEKGVKARLDLQAPLWDGKGPKSLKEMRFHAHGESPAEELYAHYHLSLEDDIGEKGLLLLYDRRGHFLKEKILFAGSEDRLSASPKMVLSEALSSKASSFVFLHNHPSGNPYPSPADFFFTSSLEAKAADLSLRFRDHIIVADRRFFSFREHGRRLQSHLRPRWLCFRCLGAGLLLSLHRDRRSL